MTADASGSPAPAFQWQKDGVDLIDGGGFSGSTTATLSISAATASNDGSYTCIVTGACGQATSNAATLAVTNGVNAVRDWNLYE